MKKSSVKKDHVVIIIIVIDANERPHRRRFRPLSAGGGMEGAPWPAGAEQAASLIGTGTGSAQRPKDTLARLPPSKRGRRRIPAVPARLSLPVAFFCSRLEPLIALGYMKSGLQQLFKAIL